MPRKPNRTSLKKTTSNLSENDGCEKGDFNLNPPTESTLDLELLQIQEEIHLVQEHPVEEYPTWMTLSPTRDVDDLFADFEFEEVKREELITSHVLEVTPRFKLPTAVPVVSIKPPISSEDSSSDRASLSSFRVPSLKMGRESVGDTGSHDGDFMLDSSCSEVRTPDRNLNKRSRSVSVSEDQESSTLIPDATCDERDVTKLYSGEFDLRTRATNFLVTLDRVHMSLDNMLDAWNQGFICEIPANLYTGRNPTIEYFVVEAFGVLEWKGANGTQTTPHAHFVIQYADNMKPMCDDVIEHCIKVCRINPLMRHVVNVVPLTRFRMGLSYITKFLKGGVKGLFSPLYTTPTMNSLFLYDWGNDKVQTLTSRAGASKTTKHSYETAKQHAYNAARLVLNEKNDKNNDGDGDSGKKKIKYDIAALSPGELWEVLYENTDLTTWESIPKDFESLASWATAIFCHLQTLGKGTRTDIADKVLVMMSVKGVDVNRLLSSPSLHTAIRTSLADKRKGLTYSMFMPGKEFKFVDVEGLVAQFKERYSKMLQAAVTDFIKNTGKSKEQLISEGRLQGVAKRIDEEMCTKGQIFLWLKKVVKYHTTGKIKRNRHLFIYGGGTNGKTAFKKFLEENFLVQYHSATNSFLTSVPDQRPCHIYIFEEFDIMQHLGKDAKFRLNMFNSMLGEESRDMKEYRRVLSNVECWPGPNVKSHVNCRTNPFVFYVFFSNTPVPNPMCVTREDEPLLSNFIRRFSLMMHLDFGKFLPDEVCSYTKGKENVKPIHERTKKEVQNSLKNKLGLVPFMDDIDLNGERLGRD